MAWNAEEFERQLKAAVDAFDKAEATRLSEDLIAHLAAHRRRLPARTGGAGLGLLRKKRYFDLLQRVADALLRADQTALKVRRQYAQSMIEQGNLTAALLVLETLAVGASDDPVEGPEAWGLIGRVHKQEYVNAENPKGLRNQRHLRLAIEAYHGVFATDASKLWHGINAVALLARARRDGVAVEGLPAPETMAEAILVAVNRLVKEGTAYAWDLATAVEACVALERDVEALGWLLRYVQAEGTDAFEMASTLRQLREVWQLEEKKEPGGSLLPVLRAHLLQKSGGALTVDPRRVKQAIKGAERAAGNDQLKRILGNTGVATIRWYRRGLERSLAVAMVESDFGALGTGFAIPGEVFDASFGKDFLLLTNAHVVSDDADVKQALGSREARIRFESLDNWTCGVAELLWSSPPHELDATLLRLDRQPAGFPAFQIADVPLLDEGDEHRVYIIGHPGGRELSISLNDNLILDAQDPWLHYRAPTEGGSSGSPVFNRQWALIGLHHAGGLNMRCLNGKPGTYAANEGIWIQTIVQRFKAEWKAPA